jgi:lysozyme
VNILEQLRRDEGVVLHAYADSLGYLTIGCGRLIDVRRGGGISADEADMLLRNDVARVESALDARLLWWRTLNPARQGVLVSMAFQLGVAGLLGFRTTLRLVEGRHWDAAATQMLRSKWASQTPARAGRLATQMRTGEWT